MNIKKVLAATSAILFVLGGSALLPKNMEIKSFITASAAKAGDDCEIVFQEEFKRVNTQDCFHKIFVTNEYKETLKETDLEHSAIGNYLKNLDIDKNLPTFTEENYVIICVGVYLYVFQSDCSTITCKAYERDDGSQFIYFFADKGHIIECCNPHSQGQNPPQWNLFVNTRPYIIKNLVFKQTSDTMFGIEDSHLRTKILRSNITIVDENGNVLRNGDSSKDDAEPPIGRKLGDVNYDGNVDIIDAVEIINHINGISAISDEDFEYADIDKNGSIDIEDAVAVINHINGLCSIY